MLIIADNLQVTRPVVAEVIRNYDRAHIAKLVRRCEAAGAEALDLNTGPLPKAPKKRMQFWVETVQEAKPIEDPVHREYCIKRKRVLQEWLFVRDPVTSVMLRCYGKEIGSLVMKGLS